MKLNAVISLTAIMAAASRTVTASESNVPCLTADECDDKRKKMGITGGLYINEDYSTKGCYSKNDNAFFSLGTEDEMITVDLPGILARIWCDSDAADSNELQRVDEQGMIEVKESNDIPLEGTDAFMPVESFLPSEESKSGAAKSSKFMIATSFVGLTASLMCYLCV